MGEHVVFYTFEIGGHVFGSALIILGMWFIEWLIKALWHHEPVLFQGAPFAFPLGWLFNLGHAVLLGGFLMLAGWSFLLRLRRTYWRSDDGVKQPSPSGKGYENEIYGHNTLQADD